MRRTWWPVMLACGGLLVGPAALQACSSDGIQLPDCPMIPEGGCPLESGGTCLDVLCAAVYECSGESWQLVETCPDNGAGGAGGAGGGGAATGGGGEGGCLNAMIDKTGEVVGCTPDLQRPDCPAVAAEVCQPCQTGCVDFFLCTDEGWNAVAYCDGDGQLVIEP